MTADQAKLLDIEDIRKLRARYSHLIDSNDQKGWARLFTQDIVMDVSGSSGSPWNGIDEVRGNIAKVCDHFGNDRPGAYAFIHSITNHWIELTGPDRAKGRCYLLDWVTTQPSPLTYLAVYVDEYRKEGGEWLFSRISMDYVWPERDIYGGSVVTARK